MAEEGSRRGVTLDKAAVQQGMTYAHAYLKHLEGGNFVPPNPTLNKPFLVAEALSDLLTDLTDQMKEGLEPPDATFLPWPTLVTTTRNILDRLQANRKPVLGVDREKQRAFMDAATVFLQSAEILRNRSSKKAKKFSGKNFKPPRLTPKSRVEIMESGGSDTDEGDAPKPALKSEWVAELELRCGLLQSALEEERRAKEAMLEDLNQTKEQLQEKEKEHAELTALLGEKELDRQKLIRRNKALETEQAKLKKKLDTQGKKIKKMEQVHQKEKAVLLEERRGLVQKLDKDMQFAAELRRHLEQRSGSDEEIKQAVEKVERLQQQTLEAIDRKQPDVSNDDLLTSLSGDVRVLCIRIQQLVGGHGRCFSEALLGPHLDFCRGDLDEGWFMTPRKFWLLMGRWVTASKTPKSSAPATLGHLKQAWSAVSKEDPHTLEELDRESRQLLEVNFDYLCENLETLEVAVALRSRDLLTHDAWYFLTMPGTRRQKVDRLLAVLYSLGRRGLAHFLQCLDSYHDHVRLQLTLGMKERKITLPDDVSSTKQCPDAEGGDGETTDDKILDAGDEHGDLDLAESEVTADEDDLSTATLAEVDGMSERTRQQLMELGSDVRAVLASVTEFSGKSSREGRDLCDRVKAIEESLGSTLNSDAWVRKADLEEHYQRVKQLVHRCFDNVSEDLRAKIGRSDLPCQTDSSHPASRPDAD